jgi:phosphoglycolate phosphatase
MFEDKAVIVFDLDGTLVDLSLDWGVIGKRLLDSFPGTGIKSDEERTSVITERIAKKLGNVQKKAAYRMVREFERGCSITSIDRNIALARELKKKGKKLAIFSGNCHETIEECLRKAGIGAMFDFIVGKEDVERHKPHPEGLLKIMSHFGAPKENVAFVGNEDDDAEAGKSAGVDFLFV